MRFSAQRVRAHPYWRRAFESQHKDHRYYDLISDTIHPEFEHLYFLQADLLSSVEFLSRGRDGLAGDAPPTVGVGSTPRRLVRIASPARDVRQDRKAGRPDRSALGFRNVSRPRQGHAHEAMPDNKRELDRLLEVRNPSSFRATLLAGRRDKSGSHRGRASPTVRLGEVNQ